jgi:hypothetical protein
VGIANDEADGRHGAQPFPMMRIMVMTAPFDQRAEIQITTQFWQHFAESRRNRL